jgi:hypothetical protein
VALFRWPAWFQMFEDKKEAYVELSRLQFGVLGLARTTGERVIDCQVCTQGPIGAQLGHYVTQNTSPVFVQNLLHNLMIETRHQPALERSLV